MKRNKKESLIFIRLREEIRNANMEDANSMRHTLITKINKLQRDFELQFNKYITETSGKSANYEQKLKDNQKASDEINRLVI
jgi:hypothetical protein